MKTRLCLIFIALTLITLPFARDSFAQDESPEYMVRAIYFYAKDIEPRPDVDARLDSLMKDVRKFFADEMERHGFDRKTFRLETNELGKTVVHQLKGEFNDTYYHSQTINKINTEIDKRFYSLKNINFVIVDTDWSFGGYASLRENAIGANAVMDFVNGYSRGLAAHEIGHAFGLQHDWRNDSYIMSYGRYHSALSRCAAEWLDVHKYFNPTSRTFNDNTKGRMLTQELVTSPDAIRLQFEITDPDELHQAQLILPSEIGFAMFDCISLNENSAIIEFVTTELLVIESSSIYLNVIDSQGNFSLLPFQVDITPILPDSVSILIPDINLATVVRKTLGLSTNSPITQLDILKLTKLEVWENLNISDLTGLENAIHLQLLAIRNNQIQDMTPLTNLTNLKRVYLNYNQIRSVPSLIGMKQLTSLYLAGNQVSDVTFLRELTQLTDIAIGSNPINPENLFLVLTQLTRLRSLNLHRLKISDITPIANFTQLRTLGLNRNQISDIAPLANLTHLRRLELSFNQISDITHINGLVHLRQLFLSVNQISDVSPLTELVNLQDLGLVSNPIKSRKPLLELLRKNPDLRIYLKNYDEPLPVTLSYFRAEQTEIGVILNWTTESEVDNAGFYISRSDTKNGEFQVVNPTMIQGAGTTGERNEYTWTDSTAKPNTVYYYRIEDVSHAGEREQLATVRLRGLISVRGKLTTRWANLKTKY